MASKNREKRRAFWHGLKMLIDWIVFKKDSPKRKSEQSSQ